MIMKEMNECVHDLVFMDILCDINYHRFHTKCIIMYMILNVIEYMDTVTTGCTCFIDSCLNMRVC
jgi:hypothetical protein